MGVGKVLSFLVIFLGELSFVSHNTLNYFIVSVKCAHTTYMSISMRDTYEGDFRWLCMCERFVSFLSSKKCGQSPHLQQALRSERHWPAGLVHSGLYLHS